MILVNCSKLKYQPREQDRGADLHYRVYTVTPQDGELYSFEPRNREMIHQRGDRD